MDSTNTAPSVPIDDFKKTKIVATIGPATDSYEKVYELIQAGVNMVRLNFSHGTFEDRDRHLPWVRKASAELSKPVAILQDLQGPKVRLGDFEGGIEVKSGQEVTFIYNAEYQEGGPIPMQYDLSTKAKPGERLYISDGRVRFEITGIEEGKLHATAKNDGVLLKRKGMNLPDTDFGGDILTEKDLADIEYGADKDFDYVAISFVQTAADIENLRELLQKQGHPGKIIAKIETKKAVDNIEDIVKAADAIMVARGDLAVETPAESVPVVQRKIVALGLKYSKPTIIATQMLLSMTEMPAPTRAEVNDVATAVFIGADAVMLSDETAMGKHPIETVEMMKRIILYSEQNSPFGDLIFEPKERERDLANALSSGIISLADGIGAKAIVAETKSGLTARRISSRRPKMTMLAVTDEVRTAQQLCLVYGVKSFIRPSDSEAAGKLINWLREEGSFQAGDVVVTVAGQQPGVTGTTDTIKVRTLK